MGDREGERDTEWSELLAGTASRFSIFALRLSSWAGSVSPRPLPLLRDGVREMAVPFGVFDDVPRVLPAAVLCTSGTALPKVKLKPDVMVAGTQVDQEERVTGDTPPARLGCDVPVWSWSWKNCRRNSLASTGRRTQS